jgi:hypothetical protein
LVIVIGSTEVHHYLKFGHFFPFGLHADMVMESADLGIPGISKTYEARLANYGLLPAEIESCDAISDAMAHETMVAYEVDRYDPQSKTWQTVANLSGKIFCQPYPLGIIEAHAATKWLWPGQSLSTGEEATAARGFHKGDLARFVVFARIDPKREDRFPTTAVVIDEEMRDDGVAYRVRH